MTSFDADNQPSFYMSASPHFQPAVVSTKSHIAAPGPLPESKSSTTVSPMMAVSVRGYPTDKTPLRQGLDEIMTVIRVLEDVGIPCCMVAEPALLYYGTTRMMSVCTLQSSKQALRNT